jgi:Glycosyl transferase 4-like domain
VGAPLLVVTPWFPRRAPGTPLEAAVARHVLAAERAGADVTVVHLVTEGTTSDASPPHGPETTVRRVRIEGYEVAAVAEALVDRAADLLGSATVVHAHGGLPTGAALLRVIPDGVRLVVSEHLASLGPLLVDEESTDEDADTSSDTSSDAYRALLARADVVLLPCDALARAFTARFGRADLRLPRVDVLPYVLPVPAAPGTAGDADDAGVLSLTRWFLPGPSRWAEPVVRALAADALAGAPTTLTVAGGDDRAARLGTRLGVGDRVSSCAAEEVLDLFAGRRPPGADLVLDLDPFSAAEPALPAALAAGVAAILARDPGPEELLDEIASTGRLRFVPPGLDGSAGTVTLLEAVADLRQAPRAGATAPPPWRTSLDAAGRHLAGYYGEALASAAEQRDRPWPRVLLVDLSGTQRGAVGRLARWVVGLGGEAVVVTAGAPPPSGDLAGAVTVDLRRLQRTLARPPLGRVRRRLPGPARPAFDLVLRAYRAVRPAPTLVSAALAGPMAVGVGPAPGVDAVVATDAAGAELAERWTGATGALPAEADALVRRLSTAEGSAPANGSGRLAPDGVWTESS